MPHALIVLLIGAEAKTQKQQDRNYAATSSEKRINDRHGKTSTLSSPAAKPNIPPQKTPYTAPTNLSRTRDAITTGTIAHG